MLTVIDSDTFVKIVFHRDTVKPDGWNDPRVRRCKHYKIGEGWLVIGLCKGWDNGEVVDSGSQSILMCKDCAKTIFYIVDFGAGSRARLTTGEEPPK